MCKVQIYSLTALSVFLVCVHTKCMRTLFQEIKLERKANDEYNDFCFRFTKKKEKKKN